MKPTTAGQPSDRRRTAQKESKSVTKNNNTSSTISTNNTKPSLKKSSSSSSASSTSTTVASSSTIVATKSAAVSSSSTVTWVLGHRYYESETDQLLLSQHSASFLRFSYRRDFPPLSPYNITSDSGWGCMLRCAQMLLGHCLVRLTLPVLEEDDNTTNSFAGSNIQNSRFMGDKPKNLGNNSEYTPHTQPFQYGDNTGWRVPQTPSHRSGYLQQHPQYQQLLRFFLDNSGFPHIFSIHHIVQAAMKYDQLPGEWCGPSVACYIIRDLVNFVYNTHFTNNNTDNITTTNNNSNNSTNSNTTTNSSSRRGIKVLVSRGDVVYVSEVETLCRDTSTINNTIIYNNNVHNTSSYNTTSAPPRPLFSYTTAKPTHETETVNDDKKSDKHNTSSNDISNNDDNDNNDNNDNSTMNHVNNNTTTSSAAATSGHNSVSEVSLHNLQRLSVRSATRLQLQQQHQSIRTTVMVDAKNQSGSNTNNNSSTNNTNDSFVNNNATRMSSNATTTDNNSSNNNNNNNNSSNHDNCSDNSYDPLLHTPDSSINTIHNPNTNNHDNNKNNSNSNSNSSDIDNNHFPLFFDPLLSPPPASLLPWRHALLLLIPLRLGVAHVSPDLSAELCYFLRKKECVGLLGGRPNHAIYFTGYTSSNHQHQHQHQHHVKSSRKNNNKEEEEDGKECDVTDTRSLYLLGHDPHTTYSASHTRDPGHSVFPSDYNVYNNYNSNNNNSNSNDNNSTTTTKDSDNANKKNTTSNTTSFPSPSLTDQLHVDTFVRLSVAQLDPSVAVGFVFAHRHTFETFVHTVNRHTQQRLRENKEVLFQFQQVPPEHYYDHDNDGDDDHCDAEEEEEKQDEKDNTNVRKNTHKKKFVKQQKKDDCAYDSSSSSEEDVTDPKNIHTTADPNSNKVKKGVDKEVLRMILGDDHDEHDNEEDDHEDDDDDNAGDTNTAKNTVKKNAAKKHRTSSNSNNSTNNRTVGYGSAKQKKHAAKKAAVSVTGAFSGAGTAVEEEEDDFVFV